MSDMLIHAVSRVSTSGSRVAHGLAEQVPAGSPWYAGEVSDPSKCLSCGLRRTQSGVGLIEVMASKEGVKRMVIKTVNVDGVPVIVESFPFQQHQRTSSGTCTSGLGANQSMCEPLWGNIPHWRILLCVCGLSAVPIVSIGGSVCFVVTAFFALYRRLRGKSLSR